METCWSSGGRVAAGLIELLLGQSLGAAEVGSLETGDRELSACEIGTVELGMREIGP